MRQDNISMLHDTLSILDHGAYWIDGKAIPLKLSRAQMEEVEVYLPQDVQNICRAKDFPHVHVMGRCSYGCKNADSFSIAVKMAEQFSLDIKQKDSKPVLVLNLANPVNPGGGVHKGSKAQEEDLCRKSSLLVSLESAKASAYYDYNRSLKTYMGSDAVMIHPQVEIIKDENGHLLPETVIVAVMTCAAPMLRDGMEGLTQAQYEEMMYRRISGMLKVAAYLGYRHLVLGAFGCGAFRNDARVVSDLFYRALKEFDFDGMREKDMFRRIEFAVMDHSKTQYNYKEFLRNFDDFYRDEDRKEIDRAGERRKKTEIHLDAIRGCIYGGAIGDALGYPVEFLHEDQIFGKYGSEGITSYDKNSRSGKAEISDDTQMSLFTANGLLVGDTRGAMRGIRGCPRSYVAKAYKDWLKTQESSISEYSRSKRFAEAGSSWLLEVPELYALRAPGNTCLSALRDGKEYDDYVKAARNHSKGCGGIMRVAPLAVDDKFHDIEKLDKEGAQLAAITHGHSLGYMPAAVLVHVINRIVFPPKGKKMSLNEIVFEARDTVAKIFEGDPYLGELIDIINRAVRLSEDDLTTDLDSIHQLGEGWVAEETLGISLYCALRHQDDFSAGIIAAVNHNGDSDSTGAVTGNILGALLGYEAIADQWKQDLELSDVILEIADDLCHGCQMDEYSSYYDAEWEAKYIKMRRPVRQKPTVFFWKDNEENGCFSNWYRRKFVIDDFEYLHVEQYMMAQKARLFHDAARYTAILRATNPWECKDLGKLVAPFDPMIWDLARYEIVKAGNRAKYEQNPDLKSKLLSTGKAILAEASPKDRIWGIGLDADSAANTDPADWPGLNLLGKILMELREEFSETDDSGSETEIRLVKGDITKVKDAEAIVNAANKSLLGGGGVDGAIHRAAGPDLLKECRELHGCYTGEAKITGAYELPCKYVIHTVGPIWNGGIQNEERLLENCYLNSLKTAVDHHIRTVAFPSISTGVYSYPLEEAAKVAVRTVTRFIEEHPGKLDLVEWVLFDDKTYAVYEKALGLMKASKLV